MPKEPEADDPSEGQPKDRPSRFPGGSRRASEEPPRSARPSERSGPESDRDAEPSEREYREPEGQGPRGGEGQSERRRRLEGMVSEAFRRAIERGVEAGVGTLKMAERMRDVVDDVPLPKEMAGYVFAQIDETKNALVRVVAREVRDFLEATDVATELQRALTSLSFEIKTEVRFIPNDAGGIRPSVKARGGPKMKRRRSESPPPPEEEEEELGEDPDG